MSTAACRRPRLYVYALPSGYRDELDCAGTAPIAGGGASLGLPTGVELQASDQWGLGTLFHRRALEQQRRCPTDPDSADLFLVPAWTTRITPRPSQWCMEGADPQVARRGGHEAALYHRLREVRLRSGEPALAARGGADHVLLLPRVGASYEARPSCELAYDDRRLGLATRLSIEEPGEWEWDGDYRPAAGFHSVPYPSVLHLDGRASALPWAATHERPTLAALAADVHGAPQACALREALRWRCEAAPRARCTAIGTAAGPPLWDKGRLGEVARLYWRSTFCLQPSGDSVSRKGVVDALLLGCAAHTRIYEEFLGFRAGEPSTDARSWTIYIF